MPEELKQPVMPDVVEIAHHVDLYDVLRPVLHHAFPKPVQRRVRTPFRPESMRALQEVLLENS
jgi:hypothetical protein